MHALDYVQRCYCLAILLSFTVSRNDLSACSSLGYCRDLDRLSFCQALDPCAQQADERLQVGRVGGRGGLRALQGVESASLVAAKNH